MRLKKLAAILLVLLLLITGLDIRYGVISGPCRRVPVLMYHHFAETGDGGTTVSAARFRDQMTALRDHGFSAVTLEQLLNYVEKGGALPEKPVLITMDDGYTSNLEIAAPILAELGLRATVFVIGINEGEDTYVHSGEPLTPPRFSYEEAAEWVERGVIDVQSHTFDLHQRVSYGYSGRDGVLPLPGEEEAHYRQTILADCAAFAQRRQDRAATALLALAYPFGYCTRQADRLVAEAGIPMTFTIDEHVNLIRRGRPDTLRRMGRFNVTEWMGGQELACRLEGLL